VTAAWQVAENWLIFEFIAVTFLWPLLQLDVAFVESITARKNLDFYNRNLLLDLILFCLKGTTNLTLRFWQKCVEIITSTEGIAYITITIINQI
jgi:hypothetical protein